MDRAFELAPHERAAYVVRACANDEVVGLEVAALLAGGDAPVFLETPAVEFAAPLLADLPTEPESAVTGAPIGPYRILREIGHGGMGTVYLAERADEQYQKQVALKLLRGWGAGDEHRIRRFREERQILAALDHPDIARLLDGGVTPDGRPWFALEYVAGEPIDRYCDERRLPIAARLELFCRACSAVQYAHRNLVVHRDLKPANMLVTDEGAVKLLDFGIAKLLGGDVLVGEDSLTMTGERLMTPQYASPEQIRGDPISTASDVYSLGVLLYELLTGRHPYRPAMREPHELVRAILEQEPERPSVAVLHPGEASAGAAVARDLVTARLSRRLRGDLDTIVLTAMHKDPGRRYGSAEQLAADVGRHLAGLPVAARPDSRLYRAHKFVRRHRIGLGVTAGVALLVVGFGVVTGVQSVRIRAQAARIVVERDRAEEVSRFLAGLFQTADPFAGAGAGLTAREMLDSGAARIDRELAGQPETRAQMLLEMGRAYFGLGARDRARRLAEVSLAIRRRTSPVVPLDVAQTLDFVGLVRREQGELDGAERAYGESLALRREALGPGHRDVARTLNGLAGVLRAAGRFAEADSVSRLAVTIDEAEAEIQPLDLAESLKGLADAVQERGGYTEAGELYRRALVLERRALPVDHPRVVGTTLDLAATLGDARDVATADSLFRNGLALQRRVLGGEHPEVAGGEARYARLLRRQGDAAAAEALYRRSLATMRRRLPAVHPLTATALLGLSEVLLDRRDAERAESLVREAYAMRRTALPPGHPGVAEAEQAMGTVIMARGRYVEAERYLLSSRDALRAAYGDADPRARAALARLVRLYDVSGQPARAATYRTELEGGESPPVPSGSGSALTVDTSTVAVLPFNVRATDASLAHLGDVVQDLVAARLTGEGSPRALEPTKVLRAARNAGVSLASRIPLEVGARVAGQFRTSWLVHGDVAGTPHRVSLEAALVAVPSGVEQARARVDGGADSLPHLADRLVAHLLAVQAARDSAELAAFIGTSPHALRAYLAGWHASRRGRMGTRSEATQHFERALFFDSTFALAALRLAESGAVFGISLPDERWRFDAIWRQRDRLAPSDQALLDAYLGPNYPRPATLLERIDAGERAARAAPDRAEAWRQAGISWMRCGLMLGIPEWQARASEALRHAFALDSTDALTLEFLWQVAARSGDRTATQRFAGLQLGSDRGGERSDFLRWMVALVEGDSVGIAEVRRRFGAIPSLSILYIMNFSEILGSGLEDGDRVARVLEARATTGIRRRQLLEQVVPFTLNRGRPREASRLLDTGDRGFGQGQRKDVGVLEFRVYAALYWDGDSSAAAAAARSLEAYLDGGSVTQGQVRSPETAACALAHWRLARGDPAGAEAALGRMRRLRNQGGAYATESTPVCDAAVEARLAAAMRRPDAAVALERLDGLLRAGSDSRQLLPSVANLIAAALFEARGDAQGALAVVRRRSEWVNQLLSTQLREVARLSVLVGDTAGAVRAYRHYLALRSDPEPRLRPEVEQVRAELLRLERLNPVP